MSEIVATEKNVVLICQSLNPAIYSESWFIKTGIIEAKNFIEGSIITPQLVQIKSLYIDILVIPDQIQVTLKENENESVKILQKIIKESNIFSFKFLGINFNYFLKINNSRDYFNNTRNSLYDSFSDTNAEFGAYLSKESLHNSRLKLDIKPVKDVNNLEQLLLLNLFNYHIDLSNFESAEEVNSLLDSWNDFNSDSIKLVDYKTK